MLSPIDTMILEMEVHARIFYYTNEFLFMIQIRWEM